MRLDSYTRIHLQPLFVFLFFFFPDCLGRRLGPRLLGRTDDTMVNVCFSLDKFKILIVCGSIEYFGGLF